MLKQFSILLLLWTMGFPVSAFSQITEAYYKRGLTGKAEK